MTLDPIVLADHPALDLLNTLPRVEGAFVDLFQTDADVLSWLGLMHFNAPPRAPNPSGSLLADTRLLRETIRQLIERRKVGKQGDTSVLNDFLAKAKSYPHLLWEKPRSLRLERLRKLDTTRQILAPLAESAADLLVTGDFDLVRQCEDPTCVLWFYDHTKSHHRRWCSMATCGNRNKVAAYRQRQAQATS